MVRRARSSLGAAVAVALLLQLLLASSPPHVAVAADPPYTCGAGAPPNIPFCDRGLPIDRRVEDLVARMTVEEKISQLGDQSPAIPRLGVPAYKWWSEALHGLSDQGRGIHLAGPLRAATSFPQVILTAASFNPHLWYRIGQVIGVEARAVYNNGQAEGLTFWAPNINVFRDPRWGRGQETPGEDPTMTGKYAAVFVRGVQGYAIAGPVNSTDLEASACCKHFTAYDLENWKGVTRYVFDAKVTAQDLEDTYNPPFKSCVEDGHASGIMCSYNRVNGVPTCADYNLLSKTARQSWGFYGYITSDCDAVSIIHDAQGYAKTAEDAVADVLKAGMDVNCGGYVQQHGASALQQGKITEQDIDRALHNLFAVRMRLGLFNGDPRRNRFGNIGADQVCTPEHQNLALEAAQDGIVLLKNDAGALPLSKPKVASLGVIGFNANDAKRLLGNYFGPPCVVATPLQALQGYVKDTRFAAGCNAAACNVTAIPEAVQVASSVDTVVLFMGLDQDQEREEVDRLDLTLPGQQQSLIESVANAAKKPVILVLLCGGPVDVSFAKTNPKIGAILWAGYPGEAGGLAIAILWAGDVVPTGFHESAHDGHADARRPGHGVPRPDVPVLQGPHRVRLRLRPQLLQVLPPLRHEAAEDERHRRPEGDDDNGGRCGGDVRRGGDRDGGLRAAQVPGAGAGAEPRPHGREAPGAAVPAVAQRDGRQRQAGPAADRVPEPAPAGGSDGPRGVRGEPMQSLQPGQRGRQEGDRPGVPLRHGRRG